MFLKTSKKEPARFSYFDTAPVFLLSVFRTFPFRASAPRCHSSRPFALLLVPAPHALCPDDRARQGIKRRVSSGRFFHPPLPGVLSTAQKIQQSHFQEAGGTKFSPTGFLEVSFFTREQREGVKDTSRSTEPHHASASFSPFKSFRGVLSA